jgi:tRNA A-37 threonylcarbamoyl transferase component Bud32
VLHPPGTVPPSLSGQSSLLADRYRIERELGRGGMAVVYLAHDTRHDRKVAIKFIGEDFSSAVGGQRFLQEIKLTAALQHPHVLPVYDSGVTSENVLYYVMPYIEGGSLRDRLATGPLPIADVVKVARGAADALTFAHQRGIVHRDIKPENILFSDGHALVADFGIARMVTATKAQQLTAVGVVVGTPAYMSPEQGFGGEVDHRADIYSLACVVYEMLTGKVPFSSPAAGQWSQFGLSRMPPSIRAGRAEVPEAVENELIRALAPSPTDRHGSAREFADALQAAAATDAVPYVPKAGGPQTRSRRAWRAGMLVGAVIAIAATSALAFFPPAREQLVAFGVIGQDSTRVLVAPVVSDSSLHAVAPVADRLLRQELAAWSGMSVVSSSATQDAIGGDVRQSKAIGAARRSRAGMMIWVRLGVESGSPQLEAQLFDARTGTSRSSSTGVASTTDSAWSAWARTTAATLLAGSDPPPAAMRAAGATRSLPAWRAYLRGHRALQSWDLPQAADAFSAAAAADPRFSEARIWLTQAKVWRRRPASEWRGDADESVLLSNTAGPVERAIAAALGAMARREHPRACRSYASLVAQDSSSVVGWLGLGDCRALDDIVVSDPRSPTGFAFRGDIASGLNHYEHALRIAPSAYRALPFSFIERILIVHSDRYRRGVGASDSSVVFFSQPQPSGEQVSYWPLRVVGNAIPADPPEFEEALTRNRARMLGYVAAWTQRVPRDPDAQEAFASVQELRGELLGVAAAGRPSALMALDSAQRLAQGPEAPARVAASRFRILIKAGEFARASALADSLLDAPVTTAGAKWIAGLAAVTGRTREAARLARLGNAAPVDGWDTLPAPVGQAATLLLVQSAAGVCGADLRVSLERTDELIANYAIPAQRTAMSNMLTRRSRRLAVPCLGTDVIGALSPTSPWDRMQRQLAQADTVGVRAVFDSIVAARRFRRPGGMAVDYVFQVAHTLAAVGDSAAAIAYLDGALNSLPNLTRHAVEELVQSAALVRAMVWRADLAHSAGDAQNASRWAGAAIALWARADPELQPAVSRMRSILASR